MPRRHARTALLQTAWLTSQLPAARRFRLATRGVQAAQSARLAALLPVLAPSAMGRQLGLDAAGGPAAFRRDVPLGDYASHLPWIQRVAAGEPGVMTTEPVEILERTSGTGGASKLIPYTARLRAEFAEAVGAWMVNLHRHHPRLLGTRAYWSVSRATRRTERTEGGVAIGLDDDAAYFDPVTRWALGHLMAVDGSVARSPTIDAWRLATMTQLLERPDLGLISVWSPSFLTQLLRWTSEHAEPLSASLSAGARRRLERALDRGMDATQLWPRLQLVSAWSDGFAASLAPAMMASFPGVAFQPKGVLATEGVVSFPRWGVDGGALAVTAHLIELRSVDDGEVYWAHEVAAGGRYQPLLTTGGGLVRYALPDVVEVVGFTGEVPHVRLVGRTDKASDLVGEKLTEPIVAAALAQLGGGGFAMLMPCDGPGYALVVDADPPDARRLDALLGEAYHYAYARELEQLAPARVVVLPDAWARWERAVEQAGFVLGEQKPGALEARPAVARSLLAD